MAQHDSIEYEFTDELAARAADDYLRTLKQDADEKFRSALPGLVVFTVIGVSIPALSFLLEAAPFLQMTTYAIGALLCAPLILLLLVQLIVYPVAGFNRSRLTRRMTATFEHDSDRTIRWRFSEECFAVHSAASQREAPWTSLRCFLQGEEFWILGIKKGPDLLIPERLLSDELKALIRRKARILKTDREAEKRFNRQSRTSATSQPAQFHYLVMLWKCYACFTVTTGFLMREQILEILSSVGLEELADEHGNLTVLLLATIASVLPLFGVMIWRSLQRARRQQSPSHKALVRHHVGMQRFQSGDYANAEVEFLAALELDPDLTAARGNRGIALFYLGRLDEARVELDQAIRDEPNEPLYYAWRGLVSKGKGDDRAALADYDRSLSINPRQPNVLAERGHLLVKRGDIERALSDFSTAISFDDRTGSCFSDRGSILLIKKHYSLAIEDFDRAIELGDRRGVVYSNRGMAWLELGDFDKAIADFDEAIRLEPSESLYLNNRGRAYHKSGRYREARADLLEAIRLSPRFPNPHKNLAWLLATCPDSRIRDGGKAVELAQTALRLTAEKNIDWFEIAAAAFAEAGDFAAAVHWQTRSIDEASEPTAESRRRLESYQARQPIREAS
jgi:tetratricopeptide (TPR) repeat protein